MSLTRCDTCNRLTPYRKAVCAYCGHLRALPKIGSAIPFIITLVIVLSLGVYIGSSRSDDVRYDSTDTREAMMPCVGEGSCVQPAGR